MTASSTYWVPQRHRESALLDAVVDNIPAMVFIKDAEDLRFQRLNRAGEELLGWSEESVLGKSDFDFFPPEQAEFFQRRDRETLETGKVVEITDEPIRTRDGASRWLHTLKIPIIDASGRPTHLLGISMDITAQKHAEKMREESLRWLRVVFEESPVGLMMVTGRAGEHVELNAHARSLVGHVIERLGQYPDNLASADGQIIPYEERPSMRALRGERTDAVEYLLRCAGGALLPIVLSAAPISGPDGTIGGAIISFIDNRATKELERLRAEWSAIVAHDLRQPINNIQLAAQLLLHASSVAEVKGTATRVKVSAQRLGRMVTDLMDLSRLDARRLEVSPASIDVAAQIRQHLELANITDVHVVVHDEDVVARADAERLSQIMDNLLTNAMKYGRAESPIVVEVFRRADVIEVAVTNDGPDIAPDSLARIFERFERTREAKRGAKPGVGLGLYIARGLVEAQSGSIDVESRGGSTTFRFTLPRA